MTDLLQSQTGPKLNLEADTLPVQSFTTGRTDAAARRPLSAGEPDVQLVLPHSGRQLLQQVHNQPHTTPTRPPPPTSPSATAAIAHIVRPMPGRLACTTASVNAVHSCLSIGSLVNSTVVKLSHEEVLPRRRWFTRFGRQHKRNVQRFYDVGVAVGAVLAVASAMMLLREASSAVAFLVSDSQHRLH